MKVIKVKSEQDVIEELAKLVESTANEAIKRNGKFRVGLSGGSLVKYLCNGLPSISTDWTLWQLFFCDERFVPDSDIDSTFGAYKDLLVKKVQLSAEQFVQINIDLPLDKCAQDYEERIRALLAGSPDTSIPQFDLLLLGMGPDGHTCSLFPGHSLLDETHSLIAPISDSPKAPPCRVTMTYPLINKAHCCVFAMAGDGKAAMVKRILKDKENLPAGRVQPISGNLYWILDEAAASLLD